MPHDPIPPGGGADQPAAGAPSRRNFFRRVAVVPIAATGSGALLTQGCTPPAPPTGPAAPQAHAQEQGPYRPTFFNADEWAFVRAACERLIPADEHGPGAVEAGVPEFLDRHMQSPYASGAIWYLRGPYLETSSDFGYQGRLPLRDILRVGIAAMNRHCAAHYGGQAFAALQPAQQEEVLKAAEAGKLPFEDIGAKLFFSSLLAEVKNGYFADPRHGGNKDMGAWKMIGYPGMRADYRDWATVRDKPYPIGPVDLAGRRA